MYRVIAYSYSEREIKAISIHDDFNDAIARKIKEEVNNSYPNYKIAIEDYCTEEPIKMVLSAKHITLGAMFEYIDSKNKIVLIPNGDKINTYNLSKRKYTTYNLPYNDINYMLIYNTWKYIGYYDNASTLKLLYGGNI